MTANDTPEVTARPAPRHDSVYSSPAATFRGAQFFIGKSGKTKQGPEERRNPRGPRSCLVTNWVTTERHLPPPRKHICYAIPKNEGPDNQ